MIDFVVPVRADNADLLEGLVDSIGENTKAVYRIIAIVDGGTQNEIGIARKALSPASHVLLHNTIPEHLIECLSTAREHVQNALVAICMPQVRLTDATWVSKVRRVFEVDPYCQMVDTAPRTASASLAPTKRIVHRLPDPKCPFAVLRGPFFKRMLIGDRADPMPFFARAAIQGGSSVWFHGGISYHEAEHKEMKAWRDTSSAAVPSKSGSRTTPDSSTRTTTAKGGSTGFGL